MPQITALSALKCVDFAPVEPHGPPLMRISGADCGQPNCICGSTIDDLHFCELPEFEPAVGKCCTKPKTQSVTRNEVSNFNQDLNDQPIGSALDALNGLDDAVSALVPEQTHAHASANRTWNNFQIRRAIFRSFSQFYKQKVA